MGRQISVQRYYDVKCECCGWELSAQLGKLVSLEEARYFARTEGFAVVDGKTLCLRCQLKLQQGYRMDAIAPAWTATRTQQ